ncbi:hypothetical protein Pmani_000816 [Petrolisthes manimaculis]|uniref:Uncharacterized protein n=1 Tax=Petrolisthes manimaculis TaxID=1843537 RepID=A0AAE1QPC3_9EUCA|nr:hypothetical protein Pmani_000816 [Petrolisthes manimaculis]
MQGITDKNEGIDERVKIIEEKMEGRDEDIVDKVTNTIVEKIEAVDIVQKTAEVVIRHIEEKEKREKRKKNVVLYDVPESSQNEVQSRIDDDLSRCNDLFETSLRVRECNIERVSRLGRPREDNRSRPMLVQLRSEDEKWSILTSAKNLKQETNPEKKKIGISKDLAKEERDAEKRVRQELYEKRSNGEQGWYVKNGKLYRGQATRNRF